MDIGRAVVDSNKQHVLASPTGQESRKYIDTNLENLTDQGDDVDQ